MLGTLAWLEVVAALFLPILILVAANYPRLPVVSRARNESTSVGAAREQEQQEVEDEVEDEEEHEPSERGKRPRPLRKRRRRRSIGDVPGPRAFPVIGTSWTTGWFGRYTMDAIHEMYKDMKEEYGPVVRQESYYNWPIVSLFARRDIEAILGRASRYPLRPAQELIVHYRQSRSDRYTNVGLVNEQGATWQRLRSHLTPELSRAKTVMGFLPALNGVTDDFIDMVRSRRSAQDGAILGFEELAHKMGLESTCMLMLGKQLGFLKADSAASRTRLITTLAEAVRQHFLASRDTFYGFPTWKWFPTSTYRRFIDSEELIYDIVSELIEATLKENELNAKDEDIEAVFLSILRDANLDIREKKSAIVDFISAGIHTVGNTLVFLLYTLGRNPEVQEQVRVEADSLAPSRCDISTGDLANAKYISAFIKEVFRLLPTAPCIARVLEEPVDASGYHLKAGSIVLLQTWIAGLDEANFLDADKCVPERWLEPSQHQPHSPLLVAPFGFGRRSCPGERFVKHALELMVAKIVREFEIVADKELGLQSEYIMAPKAPVSLSFLDRVT